MMRKHSTHLFLLTLLVAGLAASAFGQGGSGDPVFGAVAVTFLEESEALKIGPWFVAESTYSGSDMLITPPGKGERKLVFTIPSLVSGEYSISVSFWPHKRRASNTPFSVYSGVVGSGSEIQLGQTVRVNQKRMRFDYSDDSERPFLRLESPGNTFVLTESAGTDTISVVLSNDADDVVTIDAIRVEKIGDGVTLSDTTKNIVENGSIIVIDDASPDFTSFGVWRTIEGASSENGAFLSRLGTGDSSAFSEWNVKGLAAGNYHVYARTPHSQYASSGAKYQVFDTSVSRILRGSFYTNQRVSGGVTKLEKTWTKVTSNPVIIQTTNGQSGGLAVRLIDTSKHYIFADAILIEKIGDGTTESDVVSVPLLDGESRIVTKDDYRGTMGTSTSFLTTSDASRVYAPPGNSGRLFYWDFDGLSAGEYRVEISFPSFQTSSEKAVYEVLYGEALIGSAVVNQKDQPSSGWRTLNGECLTFQLTGERIRVRLRDSAEGWVHAGDVRLTKLGQADSIKSEWNLAPLASRSLDNSSSCLQTTGIWRLSNVPGAVGGSVLLNYPNGSKASWLMNYLPPASYQVSVSFVAGQKLSSAAVYKIYGGETLLSEKSVSQKIPGTAEDGSFWTDLGSYAVTTGRLRVDIETGGLPVQVDAVRITRGE